MPIHLLPNPTFLPHLPEILGPFEEFGALREISADAVEAVCRHGFMPMGLTHGGEEFLLAKCHLQRCVVDPASIHVPKNTRRYARGLHLAVDRAPSETLAAIDRHHPDSWLTPRLQDALVALVGGVRSDASTAGVRVHTIELLDGTDGTPVAWEIGYAVGTIYTSLTGAHRRNGSGWVQMVALATLLCDAGFTMWDLGMEIEYKIRLGCRLLERDAFLMAYRSAAESPPGAAGTPHVDSHGFATGVVTAGVLPAGICRRSASDLVAAARERLRPGVRQDRPTSGFSREW
jgi:Leu/Phe-tRNA-protein transferase